MEGIISAWGKILAGHTPCLSIEITRECPLSCPGCYAYGANHLAEGVNLRQVSDFKGQELIDNVLELVRKHRPLHISIVGGEPLVRYRELDVLLPEMARMGIHTQLVTSAVRPIPSQWSSIPLLQLVVSIDGLQPEHDERRKPATYDRILRHITGHSITVHCTITRQQVQNDGYIERFIEFWSEQPMTNRIWMSLYTPQMGEVSAEQLTSSDRRKVVEELLKLRARYPKLDMAKQLIEVYAQPPQSPDECVFARVTKCISADFKKQIAPCQFGGQPDCSNCGCIASAGLSAVARHKLPGGLRVGRVFDASLQVGSAVSKIRETLARGQGSGVGDQGKDTQL